MPSKPHSYIYLSVTDIDHGQWYGYAIKLARDSPNNHAIFFGCGDAFPWKTVRRV